VKVRESRNVPKGLGVLTEIFRSDWRVDRGVVDQVFQVSLAPGEISAWHVHQFTLDRLFVSHGNIRIVLYDGRSVSRTHGRINEFQFGSFRPALVVIPAGVWHGVQNVSNEPSVILNLGDRAYSYADPDHWRLPSDSPKIPYQFPPLWRNPK
jgi:dTDP-4-dehydrorhamnose 3,5-epimerase